MEHFNENNNTIEYEQGRSVSEEQRLREAFSKFPAESRGIWLVWRDTYGQLRADGLNQLNEWDGHTIIIGNQATIEVLFALEKFPAPNAGGKGYLVIEEWARNIARDIVFTPDVELIDNDSIEKEYGIVFEPNPPYMDCFSYEGDIPDSMSMALFSREFCQKVSDTLQNHLFLFERGGSMAAINRDALLSSYGNVRNIMHEMARGSGIEPLPDWARELNRTLWTSSMIQEYQMPEGGLAALEERMSNEMREAHELMERYIEMLELWDVISERDMISGRADPRDLCDDELLPQIVGKLRDVLCVESMLVAWGKGVPIEDILA